MLNPFFIWQDKLLKRVDALQVACLQTQKNYTNIFLADGRYYMVRSSLVGALRKLPMDIFIRIHRDTIVSIYFIDDISKDHLIIAGQSFAIGRRYYNTTIKRLNIIK